MEDVARPSREGVAELLEVHEGVRPQAEPEGLEPDDVGGGMLPRFTLAPTG